MEDTFIVKQICEHFGWNTPEDEDLFVTDTDKGMTCIEELLHMGYTVELGYMAPYTYSIVAKKWTSYDAENDVDNLEYIFATDEFLTRAAMQSIIKVLGP